MHAAENIIAGGLGVMGVSGALVLPVAQLDPITPAIRIAQLGVPGVLAVALVSVSWAFVWALKNRDKILDGRINELHADRDAYAKILTETREAMAEIRNGLAQNTAALVLMSSEHKTVMQRVEKSLDAINANMQASTKALESVVEAVAYCKEQSRRTGDPYHGPDRRHGK